MVRAKISDDIVIAKIKQSKTKFDTSVQGLVTLKQAGVSDGVISVMMSSGTNQPEPAASRWLRIIRRAVQLKPGPRRPRCCRLQITPRMWCLLTPGRPPPARLRHRSR